MQGDFCRLTVVVDGLRDDRLQRVQLAGCQGDGCLETEADSVQVVLFLPHFGFGNCNTRWQTGSETKQAQTHSSNRQNIRFNGEIESWGKEPVEKISSLSRILHHLQASNQTKKLNMRFLKVLLSLFVKQGKCCLRIVSKKTARPQGPFQDAFKLSPVEGITKASSMLP